MIKSFQFNSKAINVATIEDCNTFVNALLRCTGIYGIEVTELTGKRYTRLYNSGDSLLKAFQDNMNKKIKIKAYSILEKDKTKLRKFIDDIFGIKTEEKVYKYEFDLYIVDQKTKAFINTKSKPKRKSKVSEKLKTAIAIETQNFINKHKLSSKNLIMYQGTYIYYHNHITKAIDEIQANIDYKLQKDVNEKTLRSYIGEELRQSKNVIQEVILHDIATNKTKGSSKWIAIVRENSVLCL